MTNRRRFVGMAVLAALMGGYALTHAAGTPSRFDFSPQQAGRIRTVPVPAAVAAIRGRNGLVRPGHLTVAVAPYGPPVATYATDARTVIGADVDYAQLIADALGLQLDIVPVAWPDWPLGLSSGKYDAVISNVGVTEQRKEKFDFTSYRQGLHGFYVSNDSPIRRIAEPTDIAGLRIITGSGTVQERILLEWNRRNVARGLKAVQLVYFDDTASGRLAMLSHRVDAQFNPNAALAFEAATEGGIRPVGTVNAGWPLKADVGIATRKGSGLADTFTLATNTLIANGKYGQMLARWGLQEEALARSETNPPGLPK